DQHKLVLICLATGFYPKEIEMNIRLNETVLEDQTISVEIDKNHKGFYDCLVIHSSLIEPVSVKR
ncbi:hypothetical protein M9458_039011, partial [Cirrhinus mrigala]